MQASFGFRVNNVDFALPLSIDVLFNCASEASVDFDIGMQLYLYAKTQEYGSAMLPAINSIGGDASFVGYGAGSAHIPSLTSTGEGGFYIPPDPQYGSAMCQSLYSSGFLTISSPGDGTADTPSLVGKGGIAGYGEGSGTIGGLFSFGTGNTPADTFYFFSFAGARSGIAAIMDHIVFINNSGQVIDTITVSREVIGDILEAITASSSMTVFGNFIFSFHSILSAQSTLNANLQLAADLAEALTATGSLTALGKYLANINGDTTATSTITPNLQQLAELVEAATADGSLSAIAYYIAAADGLLSINFSTAGFINGVANLDTSGRVWVVNMETGASNQYDNYGFNSFFERDGKQYGIADDGIYILEGDSDDGRDINSSVNFGSSNYGSHKVKQSKGAFVGCSSSGRLYLKVIVDGVESVYKFNSYSSTIKTHVVPVSPLILGTQWELELINTGGNDFDISDIDFKIFNTTRRN